jgi:hypothetical protein
VLFRSLPHEPPERNKSHSFATLPASAMRPASTPAPREPDPDDDDDYDDD